MTGAPDAPTRGGLIPEDGAALTDILDLLRAVTGHDFASYKRTTLERRIERRMGLHHLDEARQYVALLRRDAAEVELLFGELLIGVTGFFRDPEVWEQLRAEVIPALL